MRLILALFALAAALLAPFGAKAEERILAFDAQIRVHADGRMTVEETITVRAEGRDIRRGIYRDFPTDYRDRAGNRYRVGFEVRQVLRDGSPERHHQQRQGRGVRVYIGDADTLLRPGVYRYTLVYETDRQLGFFAAHDELYWNVTGNDWAFPIDEAGATVHLPRGIAPQHIGVEGYTGPSGAQGRDYRAEVAGPSLARFASTRPLAPGEGLTLVVTWPKGHVAEPTAADKARRLLVDNRHLLVALAGLGLLLLYYLISWHKVGRDPAAGVIIPRYGPPKGYSPASLRFVRRMGYDHKAFAAALVNLAVKGHLRIEDNGSRYTLARSEGGGEPPAPGEQSILDHLFKGTRSVTLSNQDAATRSRIRDTLAAHELSLETDYERRYFNINSIYLLPGIVISLILLALTLLAGPEPEEWAAAGFLVVWLTGWSVGVFVLLNQVVHAWRAASGFGTRAAAMGITLFSLPFLAGEVAGIVMLAYVTSAGLVAALLAAALINWVFYHLMKAPTRLGRRLLDQAEGFRLYLNVAEKDELNFRNPPQKTPQLFEAFLPYALALDVEQRWAERFAGVFRQLERDQGGYRPGWYQGRHWDSARLDRFCSAMGSGLGSAAASSTSAPGSSSGSGGGGSSGGGGGGGGGGGW